jgi:hypothetical protein
MVVLAHGAAVDVQVVADRRVHGGSSLCRWRVVRESTLACDGPDRKGLPTGRDATGKPT